jgi:membrane-associated phospholipid phosphatase
LSLRRALFQLRLEEAITLLFFIPMAYALARMSIIQMQAGQDPLAPGYPGSFVRLLILLFATLCFLLLVRFRPQWEFARDAMPFVFCANVYANLYDLIRFFGMPDITAHLLHWDVKLFGVEPSVWAQQFARPLLTDYFTICYWLFYALGPLLGLLLYVRKDWTAFRSTMVSVVLCLYMGYIGYVVWPAAAPRLTIPDSYAMPLPSSAYLEWTQNLIAAVPLTSRGAFPSLHCAVALLALLLAWRYLRWFFWVQLPFATGLIVGTVYLRHHWVVDILAGFVLTFLAFAYGARLEAWWGRMAARERVGVAEPCPVGPSEAAGVPLERRVGGA